MNFQCPHDAPHVVRVKPGGGLRIDRREARVQRRDSPSRSASASSVRRKSSIGRRAGEEAVEERLEVERRAADEERPLAARGDVAAGMRGALEPPRDRQRLPRVEHVDEVMRHALALGRVGLAVPMSMPR